MAMLVRFFKCREIISELPCECVLDIAANQVYSLFTFHYPIVHRPREAETSVEDIWLTAIVHDTLEETGTIIHS